MSKACEFEFVSRKRAVRDLVAQIGNHTSKSEASIQSETALNAGETENYSTDQLEARHQREHKDVRYFWIPEQVQDEDFSTKKEKNCANTGKMPIIAQYRNFVQIARLVLCKTMDPTLHNKMKAHEACGGSGERLQPRYTQRLRYAHRIPRYVHRDPMQIRRH